MSAERGIDGSWGKEVLSGQAGITPCMLQVFLSSHICGFIGFMVFLEMHYPSSMYYSCPGENLWITFAASSGLLGPHMYAATDAHCRSPVS